MMNRYEALLVLNTQGKDETAKEIVDRLESEFEKEGAKIEQVQKMDKRQFSYVAGELNAGHYVNFVFNPAPRLTAKCGAKLKPGPGSYPTPFQRRKATSEKVRKLPKKVAAE